MKRERIWWTLWALVPVLALTYWAGPGHEVAQRRRGAATLAQADPLETTARAAQHRRVKANRAAVLARLQAKNYPDFPELAAKAEAAGVVERDTAEQAGAAWRAVADQLARAQPLLTSAPEPERFELRLRMARAQALGGLPANAASDLETLLEDVPATPERADFRRRVREELGATYYHAALYLRREGKPAETWRMLASLAGQQFKYLAQTAAQTGMPSGSPVGLAEKYALNVERSLDLFRGDLGDLMAQPFPDEGGNCRGNGDSEWDWLNHRRGKGKGVSDRPSDGRLGYGAGDGSMGNGW